MAKSAKTGAQTAAAGQGGFAGFPKQTFTFLEGIHEHNEKAWFEEHRDLYEAGYVAPARAFVEALGPKLRAVSPDIQFDPKINGSLQRINRDIRFAKDKRPYKEHLNLWFWHGDRKGWDMPGLWLSLSPREAHMAVGMYGMEKEALDGFRQSVIHPRSGKALLAAVAAVEKAGYEVGGKTRKLLPRGFTTEPDRVDYLLYEGLYANVRLPASAAAKPDFADVVASHFAAVWPIGKWLLDEVSG